MCGCVAGSGLFLEKDSLRAVGRLWAGCAENHPEELAKNTGVLAPPGASAMELWVEPRRLTPGQGCPGAPPAPQATLSKHLGSQPALPGNCVSHSCGNHQAHSQLLATKCTKYVCPTQG